MKWCIKLDTKLNNVINRECLHFGLIIPFALSPCHVLLYPTLPYHTNMSIHFCWGVLMYQHMNMTNIAAQLQMCYLIHPHLMWN